MVCKTRQEAVAQTAKIFIKDLKAHTDFDNQKIREVAMSNAEDFVDQKILEAKMADYEAQVDAKHQMPGGAVDELNAASPRVVTDKKNSPVTVVDVTDNKIHVVFPKGTKSYKYDYKDIKLDQKNTEQTLAKYKSKVLYSNDQQVTQEQAEEFYVDYDGTINKSGNINNAMVDLDKTNMRENFDEEHSKHLTEMLGELNKAVTDINEIQVTAKVATKGKYGSFNRSTGAIELNVETVPTSTSKLAQSNQEIYIHELVHAVTEFLFDGRVTAGKNPEVLGLFNSVKSLYATARREVQNAEDLVKLVEKSTPLSEFEKEQVRDAYAYIFENKDGNGLEEFMSHIVTNKAFRLAMDNIAALDNSINDKEEHFIDMLINKFKGLIAKLSGFISHTKNESITNAGTDLVLQLMKAQHDNAVKAAGFHPLAAAEKTTKIINEALDKADKALREPVDKVISTILLEPMKKYVAKEDSKEIKRLERDLQRLEKEGLDTTKAKEALEKAKASAAKSALSTEVKDHLEKLIKYSEGVENREKFINKFLIENPKGIIGKASNTVVNSINILNHLATYIWAAGKLRRLKEIDAERYGKAMSKFRSIINKLEEHAITHMIKDFFEKDDVYNSITDAILSITHAVDKLREGSYEEVLADSKDWFGKIPINSKDYESQNKALTDVLLRTDIQSLGLTAKELVELLRDPEKVDKKIIELRNEVKALGSDFMLEDALLAAQDMIDGTGLTTNAENIARGFGRAHDSFNKPDAKLIKAIDQLISYEALNMTKEDSKRSLLDMLEGNDFDNYHESGLKKFATKHDLIKDTLLTKEEYIKQAHAGVTEFINFARGAQVASAEEMKDAPHNIIKGYMKETFDSGIEVEYKPMRDRKEMEMKGFKFVKSVKPLLKNDRDYGMFVRMDAKKKRVNGALGLQSTKHRGLTLMDKINENNRDAVKGSKLDYNQRKELFDREFNRALIEYNKDRSNSDIQPIYGSFGDIVDFRIKMSTEDKVKYLNMEEKGTQNIARTYGVFGTAETTYEHNKEVLRKLKADADKNAGKYPDEYVTIEPRSSLEPEDFGIEGAAPKVDKSQTEYEQLWARLPKSTQDYAAKLYGKDKKEGNRKIIIRKDLLVVAFGEDEISLIDNKAADKFSKSVRIKAQKYERYWQDFMQIAKTNIVIKTPAVLLGNLVSNAKLLYYMGINPIKGTKLIMLSMRELKRHELDSKELHNLERRLKTLPKGSTTYKSVAKKIKQVQELVDNNTVTPLIEAGLFQSIVEDVSTKQDNNRVSKIANEYLDKFIPNKTLNTAAQYLFMTEKTKPFQALLKATQVSDFHFRYAQYYDAINNKGTSPKQAMRDVIDNYINYEIPLNKYVRYGDRMGAWFFVRYFVGIQKVIKRIAKKHPGRVGAGLATEFVFGDSDGIEDASILVKSFRTYNFDIAGHIGDVVDLPGLELLRSYL